MPRRRFKRTTKGKQAIQHAGTVVDNIGGATVPQEQVVLKTSAGARNTTGANQNITSNRDTGNLCNVGDQVKYINLFLEIAARNAEGINDATGWLEWAFVCCKETETNVPITTVGVQTLATVCTNMFRNECIYTGVLPCGLDIPNSVPIKIKIPSTKQFIRIGDEWRFITYWRDLKATSTSTISNRIIKSFMYKGYQ